MMNNSWLVTREKLWGKFLSKEIKHIGVGFSINWLIFTAGIKEQLVLKKVIYNGHIQAINNVRNA